MIQIPVRMGTCPNTGYERAMSRECMAGLSPAPLPCPPAGDALREGALLSGLQILTRQGTWQGNPSLPGRTLFMPALGSVGGVGGRAPSGAGGGAGTGHISGELASPSSTSCSLSVDVQSMLGICHLGGPPHLEPLHQSVHYCHPST